MASWFYLSNVKYYDVLGAFESSVQYWPMKTKASVGDTVYIYLAAPYKQIAFKCKVVRTDIELEEISSETFPFVKCEIPEKRMGLFMEFSIEVSVPLDTASPLSYNYLKERGLKGRLMWPRNLDKTPELLEYIEESISELR